MAWPISLCADPPPARLVPWLAARASRPVSLPV